MLGYDTPIQSSIKGSKDNKILKSHLILQAVHVKQTWGSHCDKLIFMSTETDSTIGSIKLDVEDGRHGLWDKAKLAAKYAHDNYFEDFDWFLKADDDTFVIVENLKEMLSKYDTNEPIHFGHHYKMLGVSFYQIIII